MTGKELLALRTARGLNQAAVAAESGVAVSYISLLESDERVEEYRQRIATTIRDMRPRKPAKRGATRKGQTMTERQAIAA